jgi:hypothetical protein
MLKEGDVDVFNGFPIWISSHSGKGLEGVGKVARGRGKLPSDFCHQMLALVKRANVGSRSVERGKPKVQPSPGRW